MCSLLVVYFMEIKNLGVQNCANVLTSSVKEELQSNPQKSVSNEYINSKASMAARAYAMPQINFQGKWDKMLSELNSTKQSKKIKMSFDEAANFLEKLGFSSRGGKGSHCNFVKEGAAPITIPRPHDGHNTLKPYLIDEIRSYIAKNNIKEL